MGLLANVLVAVGMLLVFLDLILRRRVDQTAVWLLHVGVLLIGLGVLLGAPGFAAAG
jgi:hypothetical protein